MPKKRLGAEQIVTKLRQIEVLQGKVGTTERSKPGRKGRLWTLVCGIAPGEWQAKIVEIEQREHDKSTDSAYYQHARHPP